MLAIVPCIPVVIQPRFPNISVDSRYRHNAREAILETGNYDNEKDEESSFRPSIVNTVQLLSCIRNEIRNKDSVEFLRLICNMNDNLQPDESRAVAPTVLVSGGLQRYLIEKGSGDGDGCLQPSKCNGNAVSTFFDLPDCIQLHIFSLLDVRDLCVVAGVCRRWDYLSSDDLLWRKKLRRDVDAWNVIGRTTNPASYQDGQVDWTAKEIYLRCSPVVAEMSKRQNFILHHLSSIFRSFWPKKTPKLAMFGPGLESRTSLLVRKILEDKTRLFKMVRMFPGQFGGVGSGFTIRVNDFINLDLITIYTATKEEREHRSPEERLRKSRTLAPSKTAGAPGDDDGGQVAAMAAEPTFEVQSSIKDLCRTLDGFIFVVDATVPPEEVRLARPELFAMVNELWAQNGAPVLVLSCVPEADEGRPLSCMNVVQELQLQKLNRPWQVHNCCVGSMDGIESAIHWVVETSQCQ